MPQISSSFLSGFELLREGVDLAGVLAQPGTVARGWLLCHAHVNYVAAAGYVQGMVVGVGALL